MRICPLYDMLSTLNDFREATSYPGMLCGDDEDMFLK
jgi:hypothetical protein